MKQIFIVAASVCLFACNNAKDTKPKFNDLGYEKLKGDISAIEETSYKSDSTGKIGELDSCCTTVTNYDKQGNTTQWTSTDSKGVAKEGAEYARDENGMWKGQTMTKNGKPSGSSTATIDDKGIYTRGEDLDSLGKLQYYYTGLTQNEQAEILTWKQYDKDSVFRAEGENKYQDGQWIENTTKDSVGKVKSKSSAKYNEKGEQVEYSNTTITKDSTTAKLTTYTYEAHDDQGNWTQRTAWEKGKATGITKRVYTYRKPEEKK